MQAKTATIRLLALVALIAALAGCGIQALKPGPASRARADALYQSGDYAQAAQMYQRLAAAAHKPRRAKLLLRTGEAWAQANQPDKALPALNSIPAGVLAGADATRYLLLSARLDLAVQRPRAASQALDRLAIDQLPEASQAAALKLRGQTLFALADPVAATRTLVHRAKLLHAPDEVVANQQLIWHGLTQARRSLAAENLPQEPDPVVAGWLALGNISRTAWQEPYRFDARISKWKQRYPEHPANGPLLEQLLAAHAQRTAYPDQIALLLPLSAHPALADAVRDGLLAARYNRNGGAAPPVIRFYDTGGNPAAAAAGYRQAVAEGAKAIVGPLDPDTLQALINAGAITVPTLTLTNLPPDTQAPPQLYQFGFDPLDEARQIAERAVQDGRLRGVAFAPATPRGQRMITAFADRLRALGGVLLESAHYKPGQSDMSAPIKGMLNLDLSHARHATLESVLHRNTTFEPRRRRDVQFLFLVADNGEARLIRPQIRFHHAIGLPVYATSSVYEPDSNPDRDLNGVMFTEMPWTLSQNPTIKTIRQRLKRLWPRQYGSAGRYYALGFDAYRLVPLIMHWNRLAASMPAAPASCRTAAPTDFFGMQPTMPADAYAANGNTQCGSNQPLVEPVRGVTGLLSISPDHRIHRRMDWAVYRGGYARALAPTASSGQ